MKLWAIKTPFVLETKPLRILEPSSQKLLDLQSQSFELTIRGRIVTIYWKS